MSNSKAIEENISHYQFTSAFINIRSQQILAVKNLIRLSKGWDIRIELHTATAVRGKLHMPSVLLGQQPKAEYKTRESNAPVFLEFSQPYYSYPLDINSLAKFRESVLAKVPNLMLQILKFPQANRAN